MEQVKNNGKLQRFTRAILDAANERADAVQAEADEQEKSTLANYRAEAEARGEQSRALSQSEIRAREEKRVMTETMNARRALLSQREDCAKMVMEDVRKRVADYPSTPEYAGTLDDLLRAGLAAVPEAKTATVLLRREDISHTDHLKAAAGDVQLSFAEGFIDLGGLVIEFPEQHRRADMTFDTALHDLSGRFTDIVGFGMEGADGK